jgi:ABC-type sugar transport system substrate-binding protein
MTCAKTSRCPRTIRLALLLAACAAALAACDRQGTAKPRTKLAGIIFQDDQFFRLFSFGMQEAARNANVELSVVNSRNDNVKEIELINTYIARKVDAILIAPLSAKGSIQALKRARESGIAVILYNTAVDDETVYATCIESDSVNLGEQTGQAARKYIQEKLGGKAKIAILAYKSFIPEQSDARTRGFKGAIGSVVGAEIVAEQDAWLAENAIKVAGDILTANPDVNLIWAANEGGTIGAVLAVRNAGKAGKVAVFGTDANEQMLGFLLSPDNILQATTGQQPVLIGASAVEAALKILKGGPIEKKTLLKGIHLARENPDGVRAFQQQIQAWIRQGTR